MNSQKNASQKQSGRSVKKKKMPSCLLALRPMRLALNTLSANILKNGMAIKERKMQEDMRDSAFKTYARINGLLAAFCGLLSIILVLLLIFVSYGFRSQSVINLHMQARIVANSFTGATEEKQVYKSIEEYAELFAYAGYLFNNWQIPTSLLMEFQTDWCKMATSSEYSLDFKLWRIQNEGNRKHLTDLYPEFFETTRCDTGRP